MTTSVIPPSDLALIDKAAGWPQGAIADAVAIELDQSGGAPNEIGWNDAGQIVADTTGTATPPAGTPWSSYDVGEFQVDSVHSPGGAQSWQPAWAKALENPLANSEAAASLYQGQGFGPWSGDPGAAGDSPYQAEANAAAASVAGISQAEAQSRITTLASSSGSGGLWGNIGKWLWNHSPGLAPLVAPAPNTPSAGSIAGQALGGSVMKYVLEGVGALAGVALVGAGLYKAAGKPGQGIAADAAKAAEVAA